MYTGHRVADSLPLCWNLLLLFGVTMLGALSMIALGLTVAASVSSEGTGGRHPEPAHLADDAAIGVWFSLEGSPEWVQWAAKIFPLTHLLDAARAIMLDGGRVGDGERRHSVSGRDGPGVSGLRRVVVPLANGVKLAFLQR